MPGPRVAFVAACVLVAAGGAQRVANSVANGKDGQHGATPLWTHVIGSLEPPPEEAGLGGFVVGPEDVDVDWDSVSQMASTRYACAVLHEDGRLVAFGSSLYGGDLSTVASQLRNVRKLFAGPRSFVAITADFQAVAWGYPDGRTDTSSVAHLLTFADSAVSSDGAWAVLRQDETVVTFGLPGRGGNSSAVESQLSADVVEVVALDGTFAAIDFNGEVQAWWGKLPVPMSSDGVSSVVGQAVTSPRYEPLVLENAHSVFAVASTADVTFASGDPEYGAGVEDRDWFIKRWTEGERGCFLALQGIVASRGAFCVLCGAGRPDQYINCVGHVEYGASAPEPPFKPVSLVAHSRSFCAIEGGRVEGRDGLWCWGDQFPAAGFYMAGVSTVYAIEAGFAVVQRNGGVLLINPAIPPGGVASLSPHNWTTVKIQSGMVLAVSSETSVFGVDVSDGLFVFQDSDLGPHVPEALDGAIVHSIYAGPRFAVAVLRDPAGAGDGLQTEAPSVPSPGLGGGSLRAWTVVLGSASGALALLVVGWAALAIRSSNLRVALPRGATNHFCVLGQRPEARAVADGICQAHAGLRAAVCPVDRGEAASEAELDAAAMLVLVLTEGVFADPAVCRLFMRVMGQNKPVVLVHGHTFDFGQQKFAKDAPPEVGSAAITLFRMQQSIPGLFSAAAWDDAARKEAFLSALVSRYAQRHKFVLSRLLRGHARLDPLPAAAAKPPDHE